MHTDSMRPCPICGREGALAYPEKIDSSKITGFTYASRKMPELMHYGFYECTECKLLYVGDVIQHDDLLSRYQAAEFDASEESRYAAKTYLEALNRVVSIPGAQVSSVLDVGAGDGEFIAACLGAGVQRVTGIEPSDTAIAFATSDIQRQIFRGGFEEYEAEDPYDLITLFQTVEHIADTTAFIERARRWSRPGGYLAIACHDYTSLVNRVLGEKSPIFDIEHLRIFSQKSIRLLLEQQGLEVVSVRTYSNTYPMRYWLRLSPVPAALKTMKMWQGQPGSPSLTFPLGNIMAIGRFR